MAGINHSAGAPALLSVLDGAMGGGLGAETSGSAIAFGSHGQRLGEERKLMARSALLKPENERPVLVATKRIVRGSWKQIIAKALGLANTASTCEAIGR